jgi:hypothetical protein
VKDWLSDNARLVLSVVAVLGLVAGAAQWVSSAEQEHEKARGVAELTKSNAEIIQSVKGWIDKEEAVRQEQERIKACLEKYPQNPERCL